MRALEALSKLNPARVVRARRARTAEETAAVERAVVLARQRTEASLDRAIRMFEGGLGGPYERDPSTRRSPESNQ